jgi:hypothetical protein
MFRGWRIMVWLPLARLFDDRVSVSPAHLESAITEAVKKAEPGCQAFVGVIVKRETPKSRFDSNWAIRGVKFGSADREKSSKALARTVQCMQREYRLSVDSHASEIDA